MEASNIVKELPETYGLDSGGVEMPVLHMVGEIVHRVALLLEVLESTAASVSGGATPRRSGCLLVARGLKPSEEFLPFSDCLPAVPQPHPWLSGELDKK